MHGADGAPGSADVDGDDERGAGTRSEKRTERRAESGERRAERDTAGVRPSIMIPEARAQRYFDANVQTGNRVKYSCIQSRRESTRTSCCVEKEKGKNETKHRKPLGL